MSILKALLLGDIVGQPGCRAIFIGLKTLKRKHKADLVVINGENAADGFGITPEIVNNIFAEGADVITTGNHIWQKREIDKYLESQERLLRPANYPAGVPGKGYCTFEIKGNKIAVLNLQGRENMQSIDCPFKKSIEIIRKIKNEIKIIIIDFHAEATEEKEALALFLDGKVSAVVGTHTHVQTADERILPEGTAYITDLGMSGPVMSVIGSLTEISIKRFLTQMPLKIEIADNPAYISGTLIEIDTETGRAIKITRISEKSFC